MLRLEFAQNVSSEDRRRYPVFIPVSVRHDAHYRRSRHRRACPGGSLIVHYRIRETLAIPAPVVREQNKNAVTHQEQFRRNSRLLRQGSAWDTQEIQMAVDPGFIPSYLNPAPRQGCHLLAGGRVLGAAGTTPPDRDFEIPLTPAGVTAGCNVYLFEDDFDEKYFD